MMVPGLGQASSALLLLVMAVYVRGWEWVELGSTGMVVEGGGLLPPTPPRRRKGRGEGKAMSHYL